ncbi:MAG: L,D-transpeptidase family protein [Caulobacteraceae bacterium]
MKRIIYAVLLLLLISILLLFTSTYNCLPVKNDYILWEEACMKEYLESEELFIFIDLPKKTLYLFKNDEEMMKYRIAIGKKDTPTPVGLFRVISKGDWGEGFGGSWMGLNVPWGKYGIHGTTRPDSIGYAASHGCIRMKSTDAEKLYKVVRHGTAVEIYGGPFGPFGSGFREIRPGDRGSDVMEVQKVLKLKGFYNGYVDGHYGLATERALNSFQKANHLPITNVITKNIYNKLGIILEE